MSNIEIRIGVIGNVDSGKSTLVSVLTNKLLDDGRGKARKLVLKHPHEKDSGRTSDVTQTHLIKKVANSPNVCTNCNKQIEIGDILHLEEGVNQHIHSLLARRFCSDCYAKYGEKRLLIGSEE